MPFFVYNTLTPLITSQGVREIKRKMVINPNTNQIEGTGNEEKEELPPEFSFVLPMFENTQPVPKGLSKDKVLKKQMGMLKDRLESEVSEIKISYELAKKQLIAEAQLRNSLPFDATELMKQASLKNKDTKNPAGGDERK